VRNVTCLGAIECVFTTPTQIPDWKSEDKESEAGRMSADSSSRRGLNLSPLFTDTVM
jgi:hypothetical protein